MAQDNAVTGMHAVEGSKVVDSSRSVIDMAKSTGKLVLKAVVEVSDVFPPLKSVAAGLQLIVERIEASRYFPFGGYLLTSAHYGWYSWLGTTALT